MFLWSSVASVVSTDFFRNLPERALRDLVTPSLRDSVISSDEDTESRSHDILAKTTLTRYTLAIYNGAHDHPASSANDGIRNDHGVLDAAPR